ncbi:MAG: hypothetical protein Q9213_007452 [Squamulea squamosa]
MPRKKLVKADVRQSDTSGESKETISMPSSVREDQPDRAEGEDTVGTEGVAHPSIGRHVLKFTAVNETSPSPLSDSSVPLRQPVERLASLNINNRRAYSPSIGTQKPETPEQAKKLKVQPKSAVRRSKEEREATERVEAERLQARLAASGTPSILKTSRGGASRENVRGGPGGASQRWQSERYAGSGAAGFLGGATPAEDKRQREAVSRSRGRGRATMLSGLSRETSKAKSTPRVKIETGTKKGKAKDHDADIVMSEDGSGRIRSTGSTKVKKEQEENMHESSEDDLFEVEDEGKKIDIEKINLISDDDVSDGLEKGNGKERKRTPRPPGSSFMRPIRIDRHEHEERTVNVNTEASSLTSAELRRRAKARGQAQGSLFLPGSLDPLADKTTRGMGKAKGRDVEFVKNERKWQGVYQDEDDNNDSIKIKEEPNDDNNAVISDNGPSSSQTISHDLPTLDGASQSVDGASLTSLQLPTRSPPPGPKSGRRKKPPESKALRKRKPVLQTEEDHEEWQRYKNDVVLIEEHLRMPINTQSKDAEIDVDGDTILPDADKAKSKDSKHNTVYLFQLPPILPDIEDPRKGKVRRKPIVTLSDAEDHDTSSTAIDTSNIKPKPDNKAKPTTPSSSTVPKPVKTVASTTTLPSPSASKVHSLHALPPQPTNPLPPGCLGTIKLDSTGFPSATWTSSFRLDLGRASDYGALQEVVLLKSEVIELPPKKVGKGGVKEEVMEREEGLGVSGKKAWAVGQMGGGFVLGPDWGWMFGNR